MSLQSVNPANSQILKRFEGWRYGQLETALSEAAAVTSRWSATSLAARATVLRKAASVLRAGRDELARLITLEMGKLIRESRAEIEKCAWVCEYYADNSAPFLADELIATEAGKSYVTYEPLGTVLAVMPWNFPFWQVFRFAAPSLMAGNTALLKHASNVPQCALAIEGIFAQSGFPQGVFRSLMITPEQVTHVIADPRVHAVTLTGSESAGRAIAAQAGQHLKKTVLELGGSDAFIVLEDADLDQTADQAVASRFLNAGQSCIAAKRFIVVDTVAEAFLERLKARVKALKPGDPLDEHTRLAPLARMDLRDQLHAQVTASIAAGAVAVTGCAPIPGPGAFYQASVLDRVTPGMRAFDEEVFGPVAAVIRARNEEEAIRLANASPFGLGGSIWTGDTCRGEQLARRLQCGSSFVNGMVKSDPRLPFGGIKSSGYGRELSHYGLREFVNVKAVWIR
jgi:succinate-semialdehyde dehydrogenase/glutarate-semialdehyde dehydrogenase